MVSNHAQSSLDLSALNSDVEYPLPLDDAAKRCLIHVKLTESCSRAIDNLINSNKGAVFSLWFTENGGHLTLPSSSGAHTFQFSTAVPGKREQNSTLECFHQHTALDRQQRLSMIGRLEHKLTVKATNDVYEETKKKAKQLEEERQGVRVKEINIPKAVKPKVGTNRPPHKAPFDTSLIGRNSGSGRGMGGAGGGASSKPSQLTTSSRAQQKSLKDRVIHILALRPYRRIDVLSKLKKATKKGDNFFSSLDNVLSEVANQQDSTHHLKEQFFSELDVDNWPFYSEAERDFVKRKLSKMTSLVNDNSNSLQSHSMPAIKRASDEPTVSGHAPSLPPPKRPKPDSMPDFTPSQAPPTSNNSTRQNKPLDSLSNERRPHPPLRQPPEANRTEQSSIDRSSKYLSTRYIGNHDNSSSTNQKTENSFDNQSNGIKREPPMQQQQQGTTKVIKTEVEVGGVIERSEPGESVDEDKMKKKKTKKKKHKHDKKGNNEPISVDNGLINYTGAVSSITDTTASTTTTAIDIKQEPIGTVEMVDGNGDMDHLKQPPESDLEKLYPKITSFEQRTEYKQLFSTEYEEYLSLKTKMEAIHTEVSELTNHFHSLPQNSSQVREVKHRIKRKYFEMQKDPTYQRDKQRLSDLHCKLDHIKKMVALFDQKCMSVTRA